MPRSKSTILSVLAVLAVITAAWGTEPAGDKPQGAASGEIPTGTPVFNVRKYGAVGDGRHLDTAAIQAAIDACTEGGGGTAFVPPGKFLTGTLFLKSNVRLHLAATAVILGSPNLDHYATDVERCGFVNVPYIDKCLLYAENAENIALSGRGTIDGQGRSFPVAALDGSPGERPMLIRLVACRKVSLEDLTLRNAGAWCAHFLRSSNVRIRGITIFNRANYNNDGIDLMNTQDVLISDCTLLCEDDAICLQNMSHEHPVQNIVITNCVMSTRWAAIRSGGAHRGGIRNVTVSNCVIHDTYGCGIKLQISGNGTMENMAFSNIVMSNVTSPISLRLGNHHYNNEKRDTSFPFGGLKNILFDNIRATVIDETSLKEAMATFYGDRGPAKPYPGEERQCISICGISGHPIEGVTLSDIHVTYPGGGTRDDAARRELPELEDQYPEYFMWGTLPAYGLYARHVKGLALNNVRFDLAAPDLRPALVCDDAEDVEISGLRAQGNRAAECLIRLRATRDAFIHGSRPLTDVATFLRAEGENCRDISLTGNDMHRVETAVQTAEGAAAEAVKILGGPPAEDK